MRHRPTGRNDVLFYGKLKVVIESRICAADNDAQNKGVLLNDSQIRSALLKVQKKIVGSDPAIPEKNAREKIPAALIAQICDVPSAYELEVIADDGTTTKERVDNFCWIKTLESILESISIHRSNLPGSRYYLKYIQKFTAAVRVSLEPEIQGLVNR